MSLIKVAWYVLWVKNMHPESPSDLSGTSAAKAKPRCLYSNKATGLEFQKPCQIAAEGDEAELHILNSKTTWSEFKKPSQTTAGRGNSKATSVFHHLPSVSSKQFCATRMYLYSRYFLVNNILVFYSAEHCKMANFHQVKAKWAIFGINMFLEDVQNCFLPFVVQNRVYLRWHILP